MPDTTAMSKKQQKPQSEETHQPDQELADRIAQLEEAYARSRADYANLEKRIKQNQQQFVAVTTATILSKFIFILDDLERAAAHIQDSGLDMVVEQIKKMLADEGVTALEPDGEFDPITMECADMVEGENNQVVEVVAKGYQMGDHLIRPAKVTVGKGEKN